MPQSACAARFVRGRGGQASHLLHKLLLLRDVLEQPLDSSVLILLLRLVLLPRALEDGLHHLLVLGVAFARIHHPSVLLSLRRRQWSRSVSAQRRAGREWWIEQAAPPLPKGLGGLLEVGRPEAELQVGRVHVHVVRVQHGQRTAQIIVLLHRSASDRRPQQRREPERAKFRGPTCHFWLGGAHRRSRRQERHRRTPEWFA